jgi:hypothetical protein
MVANRDYHKSVLSIFFSLTFQAQIEELAHLIKKVTKGKQKQANPEDMVIDWFNIDLETPKSSAEYVIQSSKKSQYVQKYGVPGSSKSTRSQRYQKYGEARSSKSASSKIETL